MARRALRVPRLAFLLPLIAACNAQPSASNDGGGNDSGCPKIAITDGSQPVFPAACGGTATASGTSPLGEFAAAMVSAGYHCGEIDVNLLDSTGYAIVTLAFPYAGGALGERTVTVSFQGPPPDYAVLQTPGSLTITTITDPVLRLDAGPLPDANYWGNVEGTFTVTSSCLSVTGSFSSPYCMFDSLCG